MAPIVGGSFTGDTVRSNDVEAVKVPSVTVNTNVLIPFPFATGVIAAEQFGAVPLKTILAKGISAKFDEVTLIEEVQLRILSGSVIVNGTE